MTQRNNGIPRQFGAARIGMAIAAGICVLESAYILPLRVADGIAIFAFVLIASFVSTLLFLLAFVRSGAIPSTSARERDDLCNLCQVYALAALGAVVIDMLADGILVGRLSWIVVFEVVSTIAICLFFISTISKVDRTSDWETISGVPSPAPLLSLGMVKTELALDKESGKMRPAHEGEQADLRMMEPREFLARAPGHLEERLANSGSSKHCYCAPLGGIIVGHVYVPLEAQHALGFDAGRSISFSYKLDERDVVLIAEQDSPARDCLGVYLADQYLAKESPAESLPELFDLLLSGGQAWIYAYRRRVELLEDSLSDEVRQPPRDFTNLVADARRELGTVQGFFTQVANMFEDLARDGHLVCGEQFAQLCDVVARRAKRVATDAQDLRDGVAEIRVGYKERADTRQNNVMSLLTVVTTVFTPLALVTGWYGMNFVNMPELNDPNGYFVVIALMVALATIEVAYFKYKRWF